MSDQHKKLPTGLFYTPSSRFLYFKIKKWDPKSNKFVWSSPQSARTNDIAKALEIKEEAQKLSDKVSGSKSDTKISHKAAFDLVNRILEWHKVPGIQILTWNLARDNWLETERRLFEVRNETRPGIDKMKAYKTYVSRLRQFDTWLGDRDPLLVEISRDDAQMFYSDLIDLGYRSSTVIATMKILRRIFQEAKEDGHLKANPWGRVKTVGNQYRQNDPFTLSEIKQIWKGLENLKHAEEWKTACLFGIVIGARIKDCTIRSFDELEINSPKPYLFFSPGKTLNKKNRSKHDVKVPLVDPLLSRIQSIKCEGRYLTPNLAQLPTETLSNIFCGLIRDIGIPMRMEEGIKNWYSKGFHSWRHMLITLLDKNSVPIQDRKDIVGHSDDLTHHQYTHKDDERLRGYLETAMAGLPNLNS